MEAGAAEWSEIKQSGPPVRVYNAVQQPDRSWKIVHGARGALLMQFRVDLGQFAVYVVAPGTYADGQTINWGAPVLEFDARGLLQVQAVQANFD